MATDLWHLPVPPSSLGGGNVSLIKRLGREVALEISHEDEETAELRRLTLVFDGVEAFRCTYQNARDLAMIMAAGDCLVDLGVTDWLQKIAGNLRLNHIDPSALRHLAIDLDDGPCYEFVCKSFRVVQAEAAFRG